MDAAEVDPARSRLAALRVGALEPVHGRPGQLARLALRFTGIVECEPTSDGTLVTHSYDLTFRGPFRLLEVLHRRWLQRDLDEEVARLASLLGTA